MRYLVRGWKLWFYRKEPSITKYLIQFLLILLETTTDNYEVIEVDDFTVIMKSDDIQNEKMYNV